jgi:hypothetical protein
MYNVLEKLKAGEPLTAKEKDIHAKGLVSVLETLHDELDRAVLDAYGWSDLAPALVGKPGGTTPLLDKPAEQAAAEEELLSRLVALNAERAEEEARGLIRWLRPAYQAKASAPMQEAIDAIPAAFTAISSPGGARGARDVATTDKSARTAWPKALPEQIQAVRALLGDTPVDADAIAARFTRAPSDKVAELLETLAALGQARHAESGYTRG